MVDTITDVPIFPPFTSVHLAPAREGGGGDWLKAGERISQKSYIYNSSLSFISSKMSYGKTDVILIPFF